MNHLHSISKVAFVTVAFFALVIPLTAAAQTTSWTEPEYPNAGEVITVYYDARLGTLTDLGQIKIRWGIDATEGVWTLPPDSLWPDGTTADGNAAISPMVNRGDQIWSVTLTTASAFSSLHYAFSSGSTVDDNGNGNWNIPFMVSSVTAMPVYFIFDPRSSRNTVPIKDITAVYLAGPFNSWSTSATNMQKNTVGQYHYEYPNIPLGLTPYKFVVNGDTWLKNPDIILSEGSDNDNSLVDVQPYRKPIFIKFKNPDAMVVAPGSSYLLQQVIKPSGYTGGFDNRPTLHIDGVESTPTWVASYGTFYQNLSLEAGTHELVVDAVDNAGRERKKTFTIAVHDPADGFLAVDPPEDDNGSGTYRYPNGLWGAADLRSFSMTEASGGDAIQFTVQLTRITPETRVLLQISSNLDGSPNDPGLFNIETATPDWSTAGLQICLADPNSPNFDSGLYNQLITAYSPVQTSSPFTVDTEEFADGKFVFTIPVSAIETYLGSFNRSWYFGALSYLEGPAGTVGKSWEVDAAHGGTDDPEDPDVFDVMFIDFSELQNTQLNYYGTGITAALDNVGRGFAEVTPEQIGPNVGSGGAPVSFLTGSGVTSTSEWEITGIAGFETSGDITLYHSWDGGSTTYDATAVVDTFAIPVTLHEGTNVFRAEATEASLTSSSSNLELDLQVDHLIKPHLTTEIDGTTVTLDASATDDPDGENLMYTWQPDPNNPAPVTLSGSTSASATFTAPATTGEYYFDVLISAPDGDERKGRTFITVLPDTILPFDMDRSAQWVRETTIYEIYPRGYMDSFTFDKLTAMLYHPDWMGFETIWLTPVYPGPTSHGYEITDYRNINPEFGTLQDFAEFVQEAHRRGLKVVLDMVFNHTALAHPFMQNTLLHGRYSPYYDWYERDAGGNYTHLFNWVTMPNLNMDNPEAREYFIRTSEWWVENYDVDGFRCDVAWGVERRSPTFWTEWRDRLRSIKPELLLVGEASTRLTGDDNFPEGENYFTNRFDLVYDWYLHHESVPSLITMFNSSPQIANLDYHIKNDGVGFDPWKRPLRFLENHDENRFISIVGPTKTKLANTLLMTMPGVPLVYAGQEYGEYTRRDPINRTDPDSMRTLMYRLSWARDRLTALSIPDFQNLTNNTSTSVYSYGRYLEGENIVVVLLNFNTSSVNTTVTLPTANWQINSEDEYMLNEIISDSHEAKTGAQLSTITASLEPFESRVYVISDSVFSVNAPERAALPTRSELYANYPNPFNPSTTISFNLATSAHSVLRIFNVLGQQVFKQDFGRLNAGRYSYTLDGSTLSSGVYFYRLEAGTFISTRKMILMK
ncbi:MAG: alpha-amylase family glycosyl hydrolase [bacterium]